MNATEKSPDAFRTIGEVSTELNIQKHILRFWEGKFPQLRPVKLSGYRRYYPREDVDLVRRIDQLLNEQGYTIAGVQKLLAQRGNGKAEGSAVTSHPSLPSGGEEFDRAALRAIRDMLADGLERSRAN